MSLVAAVLLQASTYLSRVVPRLRAERGEITFVHILFFFFLVAIWKLFPQTFLYFFAFVHDMLFGGIHQIATTGRAPSLVQQIPTHVTVPDVSSPTTQAAARHVVYTLKAVHASLRLHQH